MSYHSDVKDYANGEQDDIPALHPSKYAVLEILGLSFEYHEQHWKSDGSVVSDA